MEFFKQYPSGLRLVAKRMDNFYTVSLGVYVDVGSIREDASTNGLSHFVEHLLFKGTPTRSSLQISEELDDIGANLNAFTSKDSTCFYTKSVSEDLEKCIDVLSDMYLNADMPEDELEKERGVVLEEINMAEDTPEDVSADLIGQALYFDEPLGQTILGNPENIKYCDRHSILKYKQNHYFPANTVIAVAGKFDFDELDKLVVKYFHADEPCATPHVDEPECEYKSKFLHKFKDINQSHVELAWGGVKYDSDNFYALNVACNALGGGMSSRLFQSIREKHGLVYTVYSYPSFYRNCGTFEVYAGLSPDNVEKYCALLSDEIRRFVDEGITDRELARAKVQSVNSILMNSENNMSLMRVFGRVMLKSDKVYSVEADRNGYESLTKDDVNAVIREVFARSFASSYVGPKHKGFDAVSKIKF